MKSPLTANASSSVSDWALPDVVGAAVVGVVVVGASVVGVVVVGASVVGVVVVGAGGGAVEAGDTGSSDELHAATIRIITSIGATALNSRRQLFRLRLFMLIRLSPSA
jgi:hypothetical protein